MKTIGIMLGIIFIIAGIVFSTLSFTGILPQAYTGKEVFATEEQYQSFKTAIADKSVTINEMTVLNQSTPIIVSFTVEANNDFQYGKSSKISTGIIALVVCVLVGFMIMALAQIE